MRGFFSRIARRIQTFMQGRYGIDELATFLLRIGFIAMVLSLFVSWLSLPAMLILVCFYVRICSKNFPRRSRERDSYLRLRNKIKGKVSLLKRRFKERKTHRYFKCGLCKTSLRVPRGRGKIEITCPKCKNRMRRKT